jgi:hypothetical protein
MDASIAEHAIAALPELASDRRAVASTRIWRRLSDAWLRRIDIRVARDVGVLDHPGVLADFERAVRG